MARGDLSEERLGGVRVEQRVRKISPGRDIEKPDKKAIVVTQRGTTIQTRMRPSNEYTVEEHRIGLCAQAGAMLAYAGSIRLVKHSGPNITTRKIAKGSLCPKYVRVEPSTASQGSHRVNFTQGGEDASEQGSISMILPDEGPFEAIVMPGESLYATIVGTSTTDVFTIKVFEVVP